MLKSKRKGGQHEENFPDPCLAVTRRVSDCTNNERAIKEPGKYRAERHSARPAEKQRRSRRSHARRKIQLQAQRRPDDLWPSRCPHGPKRIICCAARRPPSLLPRSRRSRIQTRKDKLVAALKASFDFCSDALANMDDSKLSETTEGFGGKQVTRAWLSLILAG